MLKQAYKYIYWLVCTIILLVVVWLCQLYTDPDPNSVKFSVAHGSAPMELTAFDAGDGNAYVFLPSYADLDSLKIVMGKDTKASLGGVVISDGMDCGGFLLQTPYDLVIDNKHRFNLQFYRSENVAAMYISTESGTMKYIHQDKSHSESATVSLFTGDGYLEHSSLSASIKGRGNSTLAMPKRPYSLTLSAEADLLGMGVSSNWVLLANSYDKSNLNNKIVMDLAKQVGFYWSPDCVYVDLYLNGEYSGLYLLAEKVEVGPSRLDIDLSAGDFLCTVDIGGRWAAMRSPFKTQADRAVEITAPRELSELEKINIQNKVQQLEDTILSSADLTGADHFDLDSWVRRYLIDEISANLDADLASSYFYYTDGTFYAGPVWDYDMAFGSVDRNKNPVSFIASNYYRSSELVTPYYNALCSNPSFYTRMVEIYETEFLPLLEQLVDGGIYEIAAEIQASAQMNLLRWAEMHQPIEERTSFTVYTTDEFLEYLRKRLSFLNSVWFAGTEYCTIQYASAAGEDYCNLSVEKGDFLDASDLGAEDVVWIDNQSGEPFDFTQPICSDLWLTGQPISGEPLATRDYIVFLSIAVLLGLLLCIAAIDIRHRRKERKLSHECTAA